MMLKIYSRHHYFGYPRSTKCFFISVDPNLAYCERPSSVQNGVTFCCDNKGRHCMNRKCFYCKGACCKVEISFEILYKLYSTAILYSVS